MKKRNERTPEQLSLLVTGGAGFIGSNFIKYMLEKHTKVSITNLDKLTYAGNLENLKEVENNPRYTFVRGDITNLKLIDRLFRRRNFNVVINFAAETHVDRSLLKSSPFIQTNIIGTLTLLEAARQHNLGRFIQISTDEVYGSLNKEGNFSEKSPLKPNSPYSATKASADLICRSYWKGYNIPIIIARSSNNYGPYQFPEKLIPLMIKNALEGKELPVYGDGLNIRDWLYVKDNCRAIDLVIRKGRIGEIYNIGGNCEKSNIEVINFICNVISEEKNRDKEELKSLITFIKDPRGKAHDFRYALNSSKIKEEIGWEPTTDFESRLRETIRWYLKNIEWIKRVTTGEYREYYEKIYGKNHQKIRDSK